MLVLGRKINDGIVINEDINVVVSGVTEDKKVELIISSPQKFTVKKGSAEKDGITMKVRLLEGEEFSINEIVTVSLLDLKGLEQMRIGIDAPREIKVNRAEIIDKDLLEV